MTKLNVSTPEALKAQPDLRRFLAGKDGAFVYGTIGKFFLVAWGLGDPVSAYAHGALVDTETSEEYPIPYESELFLALASFARRGRSKYGWPGFTLATHEY